MTRDFGEEIDSLKAELRQIRMLLMERHLPPIQPVQAGDDKPILSVEGTEQLNTLLKQLILYTEEQDKTGAVAYFGTFKSGDNEATRQSIWASTINSDELLALNDNHALEKVLASIGNSQRLAILLALLKNPMTVVQLIEALGANSTGQIYHHLKPLVAANIIQEEKGVYALIPHRVQGIIMLLCGVHDLLDTRYTSGSWEG
jgi:DNA gyrase subunit B